MINKVMYLGKIDSEKIYETSYNFLTVDKKSLNEFYQLVRIHLTNYYKEIKNEPKYKQDIMMGLELYVFLNQQIDLSNNLRIASNLNFWRYISMMVIPDVVFMRWGLSKERFFSFPKRVWLNSIWWFIHLTWQGNYEDTYEVIKDLSTDYVVQLIERSGGGYQIDFTRELVKQYSKLENKSTDKFRKLMVFHTLYKNNIIPELYETNIEGYVEGLIKLLEG